MHITGEEAAAINIAIGAALAWGGATFTQRRSRKDARADRRRAAYAAFILTCDHLSRAWDAAETLQPEYQAQNMGGVTGDALRQIQEVYVTVLLTGSSTAREKANTARNAAWNLNLCLRGDTLARATPKTLFDLLELFNDAASAFLTAAQAEAD
jgi:hypothetical protein